MSINATLKKRILIMLNKEKLVMNKKIITFMVMVCVATALIVSDIQAQLTQLVDVNVNNKRTGTSAASELLIPVGARGLAMSGANLATTVGIDAVYWNPAGLSLMGADAEGTFSSLSYIADIKINYGAVGIKFSGFGTFALSIKALNIGDILLTTVDDPEGVAGRTFAPSFVTIGATFARQFTDAISAGATFKLISEQMHRVSGKGMAIDFGLQYNGIAGIEGVKLGVAVKNMGPEMTFDGPGLLRQAIAENGRRPEQFYQSKAASWQLPTSIEIGLAYSSDLSPELSYNINSGFSANSLHLDSYRFAGEAIYTVGSVVLAGRAGFDLLDAGEDDGEIFGPTFGFGFGWNAQNIDITIDYAYRTVDFFNNNNMFTVRFGF